MFEENVMTFPGTKSLRHTSTRSRERMTPKPSEAAVEQNSRRAPLQRYDVTRSITLFRPSQEDNAKTRMTEDRMG